MEVVTAKQMRALDQRTIEELGLPGIVLMENAARGAVSAIREAYAEEALGRVVVIAGKGNNGGDGLAVARYLFNDGADVEVLLLAEPSELSPDAATNCRIAAELGIPLTVLTKNVPAAELSLRLADADLLIDAIFGTGLESAARGRFRAAIEALAASAAPIVSLDIPSGLSADTGALIGPAVAADLTVTFGLPKIAHFTYPAAELVGELVVVDIGIPPRFVEEAGLETRLSSPDDVPLELFLRAPDAHKGEFGHVLVIGGSRGKSGAAFMAAQAALRSGAGLVTLALPESLNQAAEAQLLEVMTEPLAETKSGALATAAQAKLATLLEQATTVALGPGLSTDPQAAKVARFVVHEARCPVVVDADGLNALVGQAAKVRSRKGKAPLILTPHPGEMARLLGLGGGDEVNQRRLEVARQAAEAFGATVVLKGAGTITASPDGECAINPSGNPGMASGGAGDVLTGIIAGLLAQEAEPEEAAAGGAYLHGLAGDLAAEAVGEVALTAGDLLDFLPDAFLAVEEELLGDDEDGSDADECLCEEGNE